jgi:hypothetical protein
VPINACYFFSLGCLCTIDPFASLSITSCLSNQPLLVKMVPTPPIHLSFVGTRPCFMRLSISLVVPPILPCSLSLSLIEWEVVLRKVSSFSYRVRCEGVVAQDPNWTRTWGGRRPFSNFRLSLSFGVKCGTSKISGSLF